MAQSGYRVMELGHARHRAVRHVRPVYRQAFRSAGAADLTRARQARGRVPVRWRASADVRRGQSASHVRHEQAYRRGHPLDARARLRQCVAAGSDGHGGHRHRGDVSDGVPVRTERVGRGGWSALGGGLPRVQQLALRLLPGGSRSYEGGGDGAAARSQGGGERGTASRGRTRGGGRLHAGPTS